MYELILSPTKHQRKSQPGFKHSMKVSIFLGSSSELSSSFRIWCTIFNLINKILGILVFFDNPQRKESHKGFEQHEGE